MSSKSLLTRGDIESMERHLRLADPDSIKAVLELTAAKRSYNRVENRGYTQEKSRVGMRSIGDIPVKLYFDKKFEKFFDTKLPDDIRQATLHHFFNEFSKLKTVDRL